MHPTQTSASQECSRRGLEWLVHDILPESDANVRRAAYDAASVFANVDGIEVARASAGGRPGLIGSGLDIVGAHDIPSTRQW